jgi:hypothetical protein
VLNGEAKLGLLGGNLTEAERHRAADYAAYILRIGDGLERSTAPDSIQLRPSMLGSV